MPGSARNRTPRPHYVYWTTLNADSKETQQIKVCKLGESVEGSTTSTASRSQLEATIDASVNLCIPLVSEDYVRATMDYSVNPILLVLSENRIGSPRTGNGAGAGAGAGAGTGAAIPKAEGFILARKEGEGIFLDTICTKKGLGSKFLEFFHTLMFENGARFIKINGLPQVIPYYVLKHKYEFRKTCTGEPLLDLAAPLKTRDYKKNPLSTEWLEEYVDKDMAPFMYEKLYKEADLGVFDEPPCKRRTPLLTKQEFSRKECASQGFTMTKCAPKAEGAPSTPRTPSAGVTGRKTRRNRRR